MPQGLELNPDGTAVLHLPDGQTRVFRRPKLRQFRELVEGLTRAQKSLEADKAAQEAAEKEAAEKGTPVELPDISVVRADEVMLGWLNEVVSVLAPGTAALTEDDVEPWMTTTGITTALVVHWRTVPSLPGGS